MLEVRVVSRYPALAARNRIPTSKTPINENAPSSSLVAVTPALGPSSTSTLTPGTGRQAVSWTDPPTLTCGPPGIGAGGVGDVGGEPDSPQPPSPIASVMG